MNFAVAFTDTPVSCGDSHIVTDSLNGHQALLITWPAGVPHMPVGVYLCWPTCAGTGGSTTAWMPTEQYAKIVFRTDYNSMHQTTSPPTPGHLVWWSSAKNHFTTWWDEDYYESFDYTHFCHQFNEWAPILYPSGYTCNTPDTTVYHTLETLVTSNESTIIAMCSWFDGVFQDCLTAASGYGGTDFQDHDRGWMLGYDAGYAPGIPTSLPLDSNIWVASIEFWSCATFATTGCPGAVVDHWPFP